MSRRKYVLEYSRSGTGSTGFPIGPEFGFESESGSESDLSHHGYRSLRRRSSNGLLPRKKYSRIASDDDENMASSMVTTRTFVQVPEREKTNVPYCINPSLGTLSRACAT